MPSTKTITRLLASAFCAGLLAVTVTACSVTPAPTTPATAEASKPMDPKLAAKIDTIIDAAIEKTGIPGVIVGVWSPEGDYTRAAGVADTTTKAPMKTDFYSRIGSATKPFTATAVLQLVDQGKVGLDDPIGDYLDGVTNGDTVTIRQLAEMRSGIPDYSSTEAFVTEYLADPTAYFSPERLLGYVADEPAHSAPGEQFEYSNTNYVLLGLLVEKVTGKSLEEAITTGILEPLGMEHTLFPTENEMPEPHAQGYTNQTVDGSVADATDYSPSWGWAAGGMVSTLDDLHTWVPALVNGDLLSPKTQQERLAVVPMAEGDDSAGYGLGVFNFNGWIGHNGSLPGFKSVTIYLPEQEMTLVVLVNTDIEGEADIPTTLMKPLTELISPDHVYGG